MYETHWGLTRSPFPSHWDGRTFYQSPTHEEALARLHFLVERHRQLGLLLGPAGSGKSLLLRFFKGELGRRGAATASMNLFGVGPEDLLPRLAEHLELLVPASAGKAALWRMITDRLAEYRYERRDTVLLFDDADQAAPPVLTQLARLIKHDFSAGGCSTVVLAGRPERLGHLGPQLLELAELRVDLEPWEPTQTRQFLETSLAGAGREAPVFTPTATQRLHELGQGVPRRISQLADLSLLAGAGAELPLVDADTVEAVHEELAVALPARN